MIVNNATGGILRHNVTGRPLNVFQKVYDPKNPKARIQKGIDDLHFNKLNATLHHANLAAKIAQSVGEIYKASNKNISSKAINLLELIVMWSILNYNDTLQIKPIAKKFSSRMLKNVVNYLADLGYVVIYDGFKSGSSGKFKTISMAIKPTDKIYNLRKRFYD